MNEVLTGLGTDATLAQIRHATHLVPVSGQQHSHCDQWLEHCHDSSSEYLCRCHWATNGGRGAQLSTSSLPFDKNMNMLTPVTGASSIRNNLPHCLGSSPRSKNCFIPLRRYRRTAKSHLHVLGQHSLLPRLPTPSSHYRDYELVWCSAHYDHPAILVSCYRCAEVQERFSC